MARTALIAGSTGLVGQSLLEMLLESSGYDRIKAVGRRAPPPHPKLEFIESDLEDLSKLGDKLAADDVFCCLGTTTAKAGGRAGLERVDYHMVVDLARAARAAGARQFLVVSAIGASLRSPAFYSRVKGRMERAVAEAGYETVHILQPSLLLGPRSERRPGEELAQKLAPLLMPLFFGPLLPYKPVAAGEVAEAMLELAQQPAGGVHLHRLPFDRRMTA
jgi:uncharacterized protein YbjT (DUF2867 family)